MSNPSPPTRDSGPSGGGAIIVGALFAGTIIGFFLGQATIGFLIGTTIGIAIAVLRFTKER